MHDEMKSFKEWGIIIIFIIGSVVGKLRLQGVRVPSFRMKGENVTLGCPFELGGDKLYAVKWYKDNEEFFRYVPRYRPPIHVHPVEGLSVLGVVRHSHYIVHCRLDDDDEVKRYETKNIMEKTFGNSSPNTYKLIFKMEGSDQKEVTLRNLDFRSTGMYRCEVSAERPSFASVHGEKRMTVIHLPAEGPQITGKVQEEYEAGDNLALNCTSSKSFPPARLSWYINDVPIESGVELLRPKKMGGSASLLGLTSTLSALNITLEPSHFTEDGEAKVRCLASISTLFWQDGDERIVGNSRKSPTDLRSINVKARDDGIFQDDREASLLVRGGSGDIRPTNLWIFTFLALIPSASTYLCETRGTG